MVKVHKQLIVLMLPVLGLAIWALITSRPDPLVPLAPVPLDETHIKQEITRQVTKHLANGFWVNSTGEWNRFKGFDVRQCRIEVSRGLIHAEGELHCDYHYPARPFLKQNHILLECQMRRNQTGSHYTGTLGVPGTGVPSYWKVPISIPVKPGDTP